jgi:hypothetical protein
VDAELGAETGSNLAFARDARSWDSSGGCQSSRWCASRTAPRRCSHASNLPFTGANWNLPSRRRAIYDRNGRLLAGNKTVYEVGVIATVRDPEAIAAALGIVLGVIRPALRR